MFVCLQSSKFLINLRHNFFSTSQSQSHMQQQSLTKEVLLVLLPDGFIMSKPMTKEESQRVNKQINFDNQSLRKIQG